MTEHTKRGFFQITERGAQELSGYPESISTSYRNRFDEFRELLDALLVNMG